MCTRLLVATLAASVLAMSSGDGAVAQSPVSVRSLQATSASLTTLREADRLITALSRTAGLMSLASVDDTLSPGRRHERFQQTVNGVPIWGTSITRQHDSGVPLSVFGALYEGLDDFDTSPTLTAEDARRVAAADAAVSLGAVPASLFVLITSDGPRLVYAVRAATPRLGRTLYFIDARSGAIVDKRDDVKRQDVGTGTGVFGPDKKISTMQRGGVFIASDGLRPPVLDTFNFRGNPFAVVDFLNGLRPLLVSDFASDADNQWTDRAAVDAHVHAGWTYDYLFKRFGRLGLDNRNLPILSIVHPVNRADLSLLEVVPELFINAGYYGEGLMIYGEGLPPGMVLGGQSWDYLAGALDVVAHELTHGVTDYTSQLVYSGESGALNEAFSDIIGTSVEFFFQRAGTQRGEADYSLGEDVIIPGGIRSMSNPAAFGDPDHYSQRFTGSEDEGGVHINSGIVNQAFYLAIEGGRNRTSGLAVTGVGSANREQIERVFYRAFTMMLPANATFAIARAATIQSARDLYGAGSAAERAVTDAWTAVGVL